MEMAKMKFPSSESEEIIRTKPVYERKSFLWELQSVESVMTDGVQRAMACEFEIGISNFGTARSKWRLLMDIADDEPALCVQKISPVDKVIFYKLSVKVMKSSKEETDIISYPNTKLFYEAGNPELPTEKSAAREVRKFTLHRQLAYGCSYMTWFKDALVDGSLLLKVDFETCESVSN